MTSEQLAARAELQRLARDQIHDPELLRPASRVTALVKLKPEDYDRLLALTPSILRFARPELCDQGIVHFCYGMCGVAFTPTAEIQ